MLPSLPPTRRTTDLSGKHPLILTGILDTSSQVSLLLPKPPPPDMLVVLPESEQHLDFDKYPCEESGDWICAACMLERGDGRALIIQQSVGQPRILLVIA